MKIIHTSVEEMAMRRLLIGFEGENQRATVRIDCASVFAEYPNATPALIVKPLFADAYPVVVDRNGTDVDWLITSEILSFSGDGEIQLVFYKGEVICKSAVSKIRVSRSLQVTGEMPDPVVQWIEDANHKLAEVDAQIVELEGMVDTATDAATRAEQSASTASTKAEQAAGSAATASAKAAEAQASANTATAKAAESALSATQASNSAMSAANSESGATAKAAEAAQSAQTAAQKAEQITEAAQIATGKAEEASASATAAQASATNAASSATAASASETAAKASETAAGASATQAAQSAQSANTAAQTATQKAGEAATSATNAATSATNAATSAETASTKAEEAAQSAQAVEETAEQLAESLEQINQNTADIAEHEQAYNALKEATLIHNTASGAIASFSDGAEMPVDEVTVQINPVQDLHGYDHPWPGGGGENLLDADYTETITLAKTFEFASPLPAGQYTFSFVSADTASQVVSYQLGRYKDDSKSYTYVAVSPTQRFATFTNTEPCSKIILYSNKAYNESTGFTTVFSGVMINAGGSGHSYAPYANICPISGFDSVKVTRTGKNMINPSELVYLAGGYNVWYEIHLPPDTDFVFSTDSIITGLYVAYSDADEMPSISGTGWTNITYKYNTTSLGFNSGSHKWYRLMTYEINGVIRDRLYQLELGSTATDYEPYQGETYEVEFPTEAGTVYGGSLTISEDGSGVLTVDSELEVFDRALENEIASGLDYLNLTSGSVGVVGNYTRISFAGPSDRAKYNLISNTYARKMCNILPHNFSYASESTHWYRNTVLYAFFPTSVVGSTNESVVAYLKSLATAGTPPTFWIPFAEPVAYTLTASQITTLLGENNLWHDANGNISVGYKANTKLYIDRKIAELVAQIVNS